ncbi:hypothetical protein [Streptomyces sp. NPDC059176]|uniref:hypothetical protein n=1 Tax=unclassified Streptomyces TaxID=2593676 RepID=UPI0036AE54D9
MVTDRVPHCAQPLLHTAVLSGPTSLHTPGLAPGPVPAYAPTRRTGRGDDGRAAAVHSPRHDPPDAPRPPGQHEPCATTVGTADAHGGHGPGSPPGSGPYAGHRPAPARIRLVLLGAWGFTRLMATGGRLPRRSGRARVLSLARLLHALGSNPSPSGIFLAQSSVLRIKNRA